MGRPVRRDVAGTEVFGTYVADSGIKVSAFLNGSLDTAAFIIKQTGSRKYKVSSADGAYTDIAKLVSTTPAAAGEMKMVGYVAVSGNNPELEPVPAPIAIRHLNKRTAIDFNDNVYTWILQNDSSVDYILLTAI